MNKYAGQICQDIVFALKMLFCQPFVAFVRTSTIQRKQDSTSLINDKSVFNRGMVAYFLRMYAVQSVLRKSLASPVRTICKR
jgi:hypothetical protein